MSTLEEAIMFCLWVASVRSARQLRDRTFWLHVLDVETGLGLSGARMVGK